jgi:iron(III) transport system ATP-binding protein
LNGIAHGDTVETTLGNLTLWQPVTGPVTVLIRPESISIMKDDTPNATVTGISYFGHDQLITVLINAQTVHIRTNASLKAERGQRVRIAVEDKVLAY